jgi:hypothetical protein
VEASFEEDSARVNEHEFDDWLWRKGKVSIIVTRLHAHFGSNEQVTKLKITDGVEAGPNRGRWLTVNITGDIIRTA